MEPALLILSAAFFVAPLGLALLSDYQVRAFQVQAFGHFAKAARYLRMMVWVIFVYYLAVLASSWYAGEVQHMWMSPMPATGLAIYVRIGAAIIGYVFMVLVSKELYLVTQPRKGAPLPGADVDA